MEISWKNRKIKFDLVTAFVLTMTSTIVALISFSSIKNEETILAFSEEYASKTSSSIATAVGSYFEEVESAASIVAKYLDKQKSIVDDTLLNKLFLESLKQTSNILSIYFAAPNGVFKQIRRIEENEQYQTKKKSLEPNISYALRYLLNKHDSIDEIWQYLDKKGLLLSDESIKNSDYSPTTRDWYKTTIDTKSKNWSDVYIFKTSGLPGITFAIPIFGSHSKDAWGVLGVDVTINSLNAFLKENIISPRSKIYLVNQQEEIIASSEANGLLDLKTENLKLQKISDYSDGVLKTAFQEHQKTKNNYNLFTFNGLHFLSFIKTFNNIGVQWKLVILAPTEDFVGAFRETQKKILIISSIIFLLAIFVFYWLAKRISMPLTKLGEQALAIKKLNFSEIEPINSKIVEIQQLSKAVQSMNNSINMFAKYVPKDLVRMLLKKEEGIFLGGTKEKITVMFTDIADFTSIAEQTSPEKLMTNLSEYFDELTKIILKNKGIVDKYIGDAIMVLWGAPQKDKNQVIHACKTAIEIQEKLRLLNQKWAEEGKPILKTRIGINCGEAIVGNMGSQDRMNYTAIGDNVNLASRLEGLNKFYSSKIMVSEEVVKHSQDLFSFKLVDKVMVKGKKNGVLIYELLGPKNEYLEETTVSMEKAFQLYTESKWDEALSEYSKLSEDPVSLVMMERIKNFQEKPNDQSWDGSWHWTEK